MKLSGRITIGRQQRTSGDDMMRVELLDDVSGTHFAEAYLSLEDFARAITGQGHIHCELEVRGLDKVGMRREHKTEVVTYKVPLSRGDKDEAEAAALAPFEVDGWKGYAPFLEARP